MQEQFSTTFSCGYIVIPFGERVEQCKVLQVNVCDFFRTDGFLDVYKTHIPGLRYTLHTGYTTPECK